jgi:hypothetical protein
MSAWYNDDIYAENRRQRDIVLNDLRDHLCQAFNPASSGSPE